MSDEEYLLDLWEELTPTEQKLLSLCGVKR